MAQRRPHERLQRVGLKPKGWQKIPTVLTRVPSARWLPPQGVPAWAGQKGELAKLENDPLLDTYYGGGGNRDTKTKEVNVLWFPPRPLPLACHNLGSSHGLDSPGLTEACRSGRSTGLLLPTHQPERERDDRQGERSSCPEMLRFLCIVV